MAPEIEQFLSAPDPESAAMAIESVTEVNRADAVTLTEVITSWAPLLAVANMLMHPAMIPIAHRVPALLRGLATDERGYQLVAAVVGLRSFEMPDTYRRAVGNRLVDLAASGVEPVSSLASVTAAAYLLDIDTQEVLARYHLFGPTARHNVVVGLLEALGDGDLHSHAELARSRGRLDGGLADEIDQRSAALVAQSGGLYIVEPIPSLAEWESRPEPAGYPS
jgi:hypothetical protein